MVNHPFQPLEGQSSLQLQQFDAWTTIAQATKRSLSLPKVELQKFNTDPLKYTEFKTNFRDNIKNKVLDESQKLSHSLSKTGRKRKQSEVVLTYGWVKGMQKYAEASRTLQSHMIIEAHMKRLKEIQVQKGKLYTSWNL